MVPKFPFKSWLININFFIKHMTAIVNLLLVTSPILVMGGFLLIEPFLTKKHKLF